MTALAVCVCEGRGMIGIHTITHLKMSSSLAVSLTFKGAMASILNLSGKALLSARWRA